ncbi:hypothetical protein DHEL01_v207621 [Diaporthe helianthi]|uniref:Pentatricopeptide repeat domain-containing protein n=1 Tax=Diaporthe helianthi TaxID=158607 RepID=A0A2P5HUR0_DIAHE|nr:hypothetical protein DHEL01_v207621 [Diaporthe helianthi]
MIATRSVERSRSALHHKSSPLHSRLLINVHPAHGNNTTNNNSISISTTNINCCRRHHPHAPVYHLFQKRCAHSGVPFGWTNLNENGEPQHPPAKTIPQDKDFVKPEKLAQERFRLARRPSTTGSIHATGPLLPSSGRPGTVPYYHVGLKALLSALRQGDTFRMYLSLMSLVHGHETEAGSQAFTEVMATIPSTTFSEILRNFDPHRVAEQVDTTPDINISYGMAVYTPLGELVNKWGVKTLYVRILRRLLHIQLARRKTGIVPLLNDYLVLMRCAGAASNIRAAKDLWYAMLGDGRASIRHSAAYSEFLKARYLTEKIYASNDLSRLRLRPLDMHRSSLRLRPHVVSRLKHLVANIRVPRNHRFGSNMHERFYDEPLTRVLRKRDALDKLERTMVHRGICDNEDVVCALLKSNGRVGRMAANRGLLKQNWGVHISIDPTTGAITIEGGHTYPPGSPRKPTAALLDAIVHSYGSAGEITMAARLLDYISQRFSIPVPDHVWSDLIEYTRIMQSKPASTEWAFADFPQKGAKPHHILEIWKLCTQAPYDFQPGARDYYNLIKSLVRRGQRMQHPIEALRQIKPLYDDTVNACEQAWCELVQTTQQAVPNHACYRRYKLLQAKRNHVWFMFQYSIRLILRGMRPGRIDDESAVRAIPKLIGDFGPFLAREVSYRIATGLVEFRTDIPTKRTKVEVKQKLLGPLSATKFDRLSTPKVEMASADEDDDAEDKDALEAVSGEWEESEEDETDETHDPDRPVSYDEQSPGHLPVTRKMRGVREAEKPAIMYRPRFSGPSDAQTILSMRREGSEFTGYYDDPSRRPFAAYRVVRTTYRVAGVPVELGWFGQWSGEQKTRRSKMVAEVLRMRM